MSLFNDLLSSEQTLFIDESVLDFDYIPDCIKNRDFEMNKIADSIKPLFFDKRPANVFITGKPGIGKTLTVRYILQDLSENRNEVIPCYINNWKCSTYHSVFVELSKFFGVPYPRKGVSTDEIIRNIIKKIEGKKGVVIVFDEIDKAKDTDFIYPLVEGLGRKIGIILISNYSDFLKRMDSRLISRLNIENLDFKEYDYSQVSDILKERVKYAFFPDVFESAALKLVVDHCFEKRDLRMGISLLLKSGRAAENDASRKIKEEHVLSAIKTLKNSAKTDMIKELQEHEKAIINLLQNNNGLITGELYELFIKSNKGVSLRTFRKYLNRLETLEFITTEETGQGFRGKSRKIFLRKN
ncbi:MAG: AAA family ATPase [Candidatus Nanoarchaeia archaeon]|nr:AAA family ATPase [Candidatus Nanoarchaeia archaeon]MDD5053838.1 AAA family ATPase [Candidatus Nanoarchaeia archaeon]MDD5499655.1 AAA family ATPase [Candidatus Nanoarchaeia archaeon]